MTRWARYLVQIPNLGVLAGHWYVPAGLDHLPDEVLRAELLSRFVEVNGQASLFVFEHTAPRGSGSTVRAQEMSTAIGAVELVRCEIRHVEEGKPDDD